MLREMFGLFIPIMLAVVTVGAVILILVMIRKNVPEFWEFLKTGTSFTGIILLAEKVGVMDKITLLLS